MELISGDFKGSRVIFFSTSLTQASGVPPNYLVYASTKGAVEQLTRVLAKDLGTRGITVNTVAPGPIDTDMFRTGKTEQQINFFAGMHPQKRLGTTDEVGNVVSFLASDEASWVNGQTLMVNGVSRLRHHDMESYSQVCICRVLPYDRESQAVCGLVSRVVPVRISAESCAST